MQKALSQIHLLGLNSSLVIWLDTWTISSTVCGGSAWNTSSCDLRRAFRYSSKSAEAASSLCETSFSSISLANYSSSATISHELCLVCSLSSLGRIESLKSESAETVVSSASFATFSRSSFLLHDLYEFMNCVRDQMPEQLRNLL